MKGANMKVRKKILAGASALALGAGLSLAAVPAQAVIVPEGNGFVETKKAVDAGGVVHNVSVDWNYLYNFQGKTRVSVNPLKVVRTDEAVLKTGNPEDAGLDLRFDVYYSGGSTLQTRVYDGIDLDEGADNQVSVNPANPLDRPGISSIRVKVGTDADGLGDSPWIYFRQPSGVSFQP
jgi:hypothetical protein